MSQLSTGKLSPKEKLLPILTNKNVDIKKEMLAGLTTFLTMAYILAVNPNILSATGMPAGPIVTATCLSAALACILMGLLANLPFALASGMGLNAYFAYSVVLGMGISWEVALTAVFAKSEIQIWECRNCGHIVVGKKAPQLCPVCAHPQSFFEIRKENY